MSEKVASRFAAAVARGERVVVATVVAGPNAGAQLLVGTAGQTYGDLGWPRLNQRVALYAEQLLDRKDPPETSTKRFEVPGAGEVAVAIELAAPA